MADVKRKAVGKAVGAGVRKLPARWQRYLRELSESVDEGLEALEPRSRSGRNAAEGMSRTKERALEKAVREQRPERAGEVELPEETSEAVRKSAKSLAEKLRSRGEIGRDAARKRKKQKK